MKDAVYDLHQWCQTANNPMMRLYAIAGFAAMLSAPAIGRSQGEANISGRRFQIIATNTLLGGLTSGISELSRGESFWKGMLRGSAGGATVFLGKCLIGGRTAGGRILGLPTVALGSSVVANASAGRALFERIELPIGPVRVVRDNRNRETWLKLDVATTSGLIYFATRPHSSFQLGESLKRGLPVFYGASQQNDLEAVRVVFMSRPSEEYRFSHELIHAAQSEFVTQAWQSPLEEWAMGDGPRARFVTRHAAIGALYPFWALVNQVIEHRNRPWEKESRFFEGGC